MGEVLRERKWSARRRTLPPDPKSLEELFQGIHRQILSRAEHLRTNPHDLHERRGFQDLLTQRVKAWLEIYKLKPRRAQELGQDLGLIFSGNPQDYILQEEESE